MAQQPTTPTTPSITESGAIASLRNWICTDSSSLASGAVAIVTTQGAHRANKGAMGCALLLLGISEMADYPAASTIWIRTEPLLTVDSESTRNTIPDSPIMTSEGMRTILRYMGRLVGGLLFMVGCLWMCTLRAMEMTIRWAKKAKDARIGNAIPIIPTNAQSSRHSNAAAFAENHLRPTPQLRCKQTGVAKTRLLRGDIIAMTSGNAISGKRGRIEVGVLKKHSD